jgi:hypothetical protein
MANGTVIRASYEDFTLTFELNEHRRFVSLRWAVAMWAVLTLTYSVASNNTFAHARTLPPEDADASRSMSRAVRHRARCDM